MAYVVQKANPPSVTALRRVLTKQPAERSKWLPLIQPKSVHHAIVKSRFRSSVGSLAIEMGTAISVMRAEAGSRRHTRKPMLAKPVRSDLSVLQNDAKKGNGVCGIRNTACQGTRFQRCFWPRMAAALFAPQISQEAGTDSVLTIATKLDGSEVYFATIVIPRLVS